MTTDKVDNLDYLTSIGMPLSELMRRTSQGESLDDIRADTSSKLLYKGGAILSTAENYLTILRTDSNFAPVRFNMLRGYPERVVNGKRYPWTDADDAAARTYIETRYGISSRPKYEDALNVFLREREYHPVRDMIGNFVWDGKEHCEQFFIRWMGVEDTPYSREVTRLLFAGGINRAFNAGCKFDAVPVLIGAQGGGKSTICQWLALDDDFYSGCKTISGQKGLESIQGKWLIEIEELLAVIANERAGQRIEESAKAFLSTRSDFYRKPYDRRPQDYPRHCIFIGTTNRSEFLTDKTGNRRWFPLQCHSDGRTVFEHESEIRADIEQAWAEMLYAYQTQDEFARPTERVELLGVIREAQASAEVDDYRIGLIAAYLEEKTRVCLLQIWRDAIYRNAISVPPMSRKDSLELAEILTSQLGWLRGGVSNFGVDGKQKAYFAPNTDF